MRWALMISVHGIFLRRTGSKTFVEFGIEIVIALISSRPLMRNHLNSMQMSPTSGTETIKSDCFGLFAMYTPYHQNFNRAAASANIFKSCTGALATGAMGIAQSVLF